MSALDSIFSAVQRTRAVIQPNYTTTPCPEPFRHILLLISKSYSYTVMNKFPSLLYFVWFLFFDQTRAIHPFSRVKEVKGFVFPGATIRGNTQRNATKAYLRERQQKNDVDGTSSGHPNQGRLLSSIVAQMADIHTLYTTKEKQKKC